MPCVRFLPKAARRCCAFLPAEKGFRDDEHRRQHAARWPKDWPLQAIPPVAWAGQRPTYRDASPAIIDAALDRSQRRPTGNWYVFAASRDVRPGRPFGTRVAGVELVAWRDQQSRLHVGPRSCPHLGADLATAAVASRCLDLPMARTVPRRRHRRIRVAAAAQPRRRCAGVGASGQRRRRRAAGSAGDFGQANRRHAARRHPTGRHVRARRYHRQPPRSVARRMISPLLVYPARGTDHLRPTRRTASWSR